MFVRTNASRQNCRLGRSISRLSYLSEPHLPRRPGSLQSSSASPNFSSPLSSAPTRTISTSQIPYTWRRHTQRRGRRPNLSLLSSCDSNTVYLPTRTFATAVEDLPITVANNDLSKLYTLRTFDPSASLDLVALPEPKRTPKTVPTSAKFGPGDHNVALSVFEACVRVGKMERAALLLNRMQEKRSLDPDQLITMQNQYLEGCIRQLKADPGVGKAEALHAWYEVNIHAARLPQTPETIAYMLKASLLTTTTKGTRLTRLIKRYMDMVPSDQGLDVLYCTDILTDPDIAAITKLYPEFNVADFEGDSTFELTEPVVDDAVDLSEPTSDPTDIAYDGSSVPNVLETPQKGGGLVAIQSTLQVFSKMKDGHDISLLPYRERREFQSRLERDCIDAAVHRWREMAEGLRAHGANTFMGNPNLNFSLWFWHQDLEAHLQREFDLIHKAMSSDSGGRGKEVKDHNRCEYGPILLQSTPSRLAAITTMSVLNSIAFSGGEKGVTMSALLSAISSAAEEDIISQKYEQVKKVEMRKRRLEWILEQRHKAQCQSEADDQLQDDVPRDDKKKASTLHNDKPVRERSTPWPVSTRMKIAAVLLSGLVDGAKIKVVREHPETKEKIVSRQPAFTHCIQHRRGRKVGVIMPHPTLTETMRKEPRADFLARHLPMVVRPEPWSKIDQGGYIDSPVPLVRVKAGEQDQKLYAAAALARGDLEQVTKGLDILGKTAWRINRPVFDVFLEAWNTGEAIAKVPPLHPDIPLPEEPVASASPLERRHWVHDVKRASNLRASYHSVRCYMNFQLEIARAFRDQEFFFPHNVDFRGRAYPIPTYLNHMGADHIRGLLRFSKGRELGERGLMWLKVHLANVHGFDKASLKDRAAFAEENLPNVIDSATNPFKGKRWWLKAENPWQCLAACHELKAAMDLPDPTKYVSSLPVHQDGTCNGLQHYAALGGDTWGAQQVNLLPGDKPADVYSAVADLVKKSIAEDAKLGNATAKALTDKIKRKIVKQTVMTNVYGVTFMGAKAQVLKQINAHYPDFERETGTQPTLAATYIATQIFKALATMFKGAHDIQFWLGEIGGRICRALTAEQLEQVVEDNMEPASGSNKAKKIVSREDLLSLCRSTIIWTTPLRLPVVQPYRTHQEKLIPTCMQFLTIRNPNRFDPVNSRKQLQAFPPNFIHSLDASHMLLSALECDERGLAFAAVHDSFWTHAADVDVMNRVLRDAFIRIHSEDVIKRLAAEFETRYKGGLYLARIDASSEAGKAVLRWRASHKRLSGRDEIVMEKQRLDLLNSKIKSRRKKGEAMSTPASVCEQLTPDLEADLVKEDLTDNLLGSLNSASTSSSAEDDIVDSDAHGEGMGHDDDFHEPTAEDAGIENDETMDDETSNLKAVKTRRDKELVLGQYTESNFATKVKSDTIRVHKKKTRFVQVWLPVSFPEVPQKGDFDVNQLRDSEYFFS